MSGPDRIRVGLTALLATALAVAGMLPPFANAAWPIAGLWAAAAWASLGLSVWAAGVLCAVGVFYDLMYEAPLGAWPLAFLAAYSVGLVAMARTPPMSRFTAEAISVFGGLTAAAVALAVASDLVGGADLSRGGMVADFMLTALFYPLARLVMPRAPEAEARR